MSKKAKVKIDVNDLYASDAIRDKVQPLFTGGFTPEDLAMAMSNGTITKMNATGDKLIAASFDEVMDLAVANGYSADTPVDDTDHSSVNEGGPDEKSDEPVKEPHPTIEPDADLLASGKEDGSVAEIQDEKTGEMRPMTIEEAAEIAKTALIAEERESEVTEDTPTHTYYRTIGDNQPSVVIGNIKPFSGPNGSWMYAVHKDVLADWRKEAPIGGALQPCNPDGSLKF